MSAPSRGMSPQLPRRSGPRSSKNPATVRPSVPEFLVMRSARARLTSVQPTNAMRRLSCGSFSRRRIASCRYSATITSNAGVTTTHVSTTRRENSSEYFVTYPMPRRMAMITIQRTSTLRASGTVAGTTGVCPFVRPRGSSELSTATDRASTWKNCTNSAS